MSSPKLNSKKGNKPRRFKVLVLGQSGVGKTALIVRFVTRRFIFDYDSTLERKYTVQAEVAGDLVLYEIQDIAGQDTQTKGVSVQEYIKWADAFILVFSTTDSCSFNECTRLRFLINCVKKYKSKSSHVIQKEPVVMLVGNKKDLHQDRMVSYTEAKVKCKEICCSLYHEISVKESVEESSLVFSELFRQYKLGYSCPVSSEDAGSSPELRHVRRYRNFVVSEGNSGSGESSHDKETKRKMHRSIIKKVMPSLKQKSFGDDS